jgi:TRAP-type C4-dicarboxylate transport system substrate-binding protein
MVPRTRFLTIGLALAVSLAACAPATASLPTPLLTPAPAAATAVPPTDTPVTLRLAVSDTQERPSDPFVREFIAQANTLSGGTLTIEPIWDAGADTSAGFEAGVIQLVQAGDADLGLAASRAWDAEAFPALQVLQAPFLITDDALAEAVATSTVASQILESLAPGGIVGLTLWPEDLRHPFSVDPTKPLLSPADFAGLTFRTSDSGLSAAIVRALGGNPLFEAEDYQGAESGLLQGVTLNGRPAATGNVVFFPKYQVLFANGTAFAGLSAAQQAALRQAAVATQSRALAEHPGEAEAGAQWCADGGTIFLTSAEQVAAFEAAAQPVYEAISAVPANAALIATIRALKAETVAAPGASACAPAELPVTPTPDVKFIADSGLPPNGAWQVDLTLDEMMAMGMLKSKARDWAGLTTWTFKDGKAQIDYVSPYHPSASFTCKASLEVVDDFVRFTYAAGGECDGEVDDIQWHLADDGLHLHLVNIVGSEFEGNRDYLEAKPWQLVTDTP